MLDFSIDFDRILLDTAVFSVFVSTPFVIMVGCVVGLLRMRKVLRDRKRKAQPAPIFDTDFDWNS